jgi:predicted acetyltransferase
MLEDLVHLYLAELASEARLAPGSDGRFRYAGLTGYFEGQGRYAYIFRVEDVPVGFALVAEQSLLGLGEAGHALAEFFVLPSYRRCGVGAAAATALFARLPGGWWIGQTVWNAPAQTFWRKVVGRYTGGRYHEERFDWGTERGVAQRFTARTSEIGDGP